MRSPQAAAPTTDATTIEASETASPPDPLFGGSSGFLGPTSFSAVFLENRNGLLTPTSGPIAASPQSKGFSVDEESVRLGASILNQLPDQTTSATLFARYKRTRTTMGDLGLGHCLDSLWTTFGQQLSLKTRRASNLEDVSQLITQNSIATLEPGESFDDWLDAITGRRIRWEAMGLLFTAWAFGSLSSPDDDEIFAKQEASRGDRMKFAVDMQKLGLACANLSDQTRFVNVLSVFLSYQSCILETVINGDSSITAWRMHQDVMALTTFSGIHRETGGGDTSKIAFFSQFRRRLFANIYDFDKQLAAFTGRPPGLSRRHTSCLLPLDLSDEVLIAGGQDLHAAVESLDINGWNRNGQIYPATRARACCLLAEIRDEALEIALNPTGLNMLSRIDELKTRSHALHEQFPASVVYMHEEASILFNSEGSSSMLPVASLLRLRLDHLQNHFLLERLALKCGQTDTRALIDISREILQLTIILWTQRDRFQAKRYNLEWMAMFYGAPASGILCVELLKQRSSSPTVPRSEIIQNLSIFAAFLGWVRPSAPNADLCSSIKSIIGHVMDRVLNGSAETANLDDSAALNNWDIDLSLWDDVGSLDLLDTYDCFRAPSWHVTE